MTKTRNPFAVLLLCFLVGMTHGAVFEMGQVSPYYENLATVEHGTSISSPAESAPGFDFRTIIDPQRHPGPSKTGTFIFADRDQQEIFTIDLGRVRASGLAVVRTHPGDGTVHGDPDGRRPKQMVIEASADGSDGSWRTLRAWTEPDRVPRKQSITWDDEPTRYLRFDLGRNTDAIGSVMADVSVFPRFELPPLSERLNDLDRLFRRDVPELESFRKALAAGDLDASMSALRSHFARAPVAIGQAVAKYGQAADDWMNGIVRFEDLSWKMAGLKFDWYFFPYDISHELPSYWVAGSPFWYLPDYCNSNPDPRYVRCAARMIRDWMADVPCPGVHRVPGRNGWFMVEGWPAIRVANRTGGLARALVAFAPHRNEFDDDTWAQLLYGIWEHAAFLAHVAPEIGGNWLTWANERLLRTATQFPEFRDQRDWLRVGRREFERVVRDNVSDDGKECEDTTYYCLRAMAEILGMYEQFTGSGIELSPQAEARVRNALDFPAWIHLPDFRNPGIGDMGKVDSPRRSIPLVEEYADAWGRDDLVYINSRGQRGTKPKQTSRAFQADGWFVMRSDWDDGLDARHLIFRAPPATCRGHGHRDVLAIVLYAYGRPLLIDPGMTLYGTKGSDRYTLTEMHNTVTVDDAPQKHGPGKVEAWESTDTYDLAEAEHALYADLTHRRLVIFVKPDYYVLIDELTGKDERTLDWNYQFLEGADPTQSGPVIRTNFPTGGNLAIVPVAANGIDSSAPRPFNYVTPAAKEGTEVSSMGWRIRIRGELPKRLVTVLFPFKGPVLPDGFRVTAEAGNAVMVRQDRGTDLVSWRPQGTPGAWTFRHAGREYRGAGGALVVRNTRPD